MLQSTDARKNLNRLLKLPINQLKRERTPLENNLISLLPQLKKCENVDVLMELATEENYKNNAF
jgi:hypothetical protein